jgi:2-amino-4-hydroxy-6-hydroxymethyldihydropteridine diphosphokinase
VKFDLLLSLGSNINPRDFFLKKAILLLNEKFEFSNISSLYKTHPMYDAKQDYFYNLCAFYNTDIAEVYDILTITKGIEEVIGRAKDKDRPKGPRNIDIDIIFYSDLKINSDNLNIPHKGLFERNFVMIPLLEILPDYLRKSYDFSGFIDANKGQIVEKIGELDLER